MSASWRCSTQAPQWCRGLAQWGFRQDCVPLKQEWDGPEARQDRLIYIYDVLKRLKEDAPGYDLLHRVFHDQYVVEKGKVELKDKHKVSSDSLQSPDDPDATYRDKNGQKVSGYVTNITETVEEDKPSIITSIQTDPVTFADWHFLEDAVHNTERVTGQPVKNVYADGAYQSPDNRKFAMLHMGMELLTSKLQGGCRYLLDREPWTDNFKVTDTETGEVMDAIYVGESTRGQTLEGEPLACQAHTPLALFQWFRISR